MRGGLSDIAARLAALGAASRRLVVIPPDEVQTYKVDSPALAGRRLRATHALSGEMEIEGDVTRLHAAVTDLSTGSVLRRFDGEFRPGDLVAVSTSLAGVVTSAFHLGAAPPAGIKPEAYAEFASGLALLRRDQPAFDEAIRHFGSAQKIDPQSPLVLAGLAEAYSRKFRSTKDSRWLQEASAAAKRAESLQPDSVPVLQVLSSIQQAEGKPELAIELLERAVELDANNSDVWRQMGTALDGVGRSEEAIASLRKSIQFAPDYFRPHRDLGTFYARKGKFREAIEEYQIVTRLAPELAEGYSDLGGVLLAAGREQEAESALRKSLTFRETRAALNNLGVLLRFQHRDAEAAPIMLRGLAAGPDDATIRLNLANALRRTGDTAEARQHYQRANELSRAALLLNPRDSASRARLAYTLVRLGTPALAGDEALQAVQLASSDYYTLFWSIMTLDALGRREEAYPLLSAATPQQLTDLRRQPDLTEFTKDRRFPVPVNTISNTERSSNGRN
jgi:Flp pilus assembly protein TadD